MDRKNITGWNIRQIRIAKGLTVHQLSSALPKSSPLSSEELGRIESGTRKAFDQEILAISKVLKVPVEALFSLHRK